MGSVLEGGEGRGDSWIKGVGGGVGGAKHVGEGRVRMFHIDKMAYRS